MFVVLICLKERGFGILFSLLLLSVFIPVALFLWAYFYSKAYNMWLKHLYYKSLISFV